MFSISRALDSRVLLAVLALSIVTPACRRQEPAERQVQNLDQVLAAVPDAAMRERWRTAQKEGRLPPLDMLRLPTQPVSARQRAAVPSTESPQTTARVPQAAVADVRAVASQPIADYDGAVTLDNVDQGRIVARLPEAAKSVRVELAYKLPQGATLAPPTPQPVSLFLSESVPAGSQRRIVGLSQARTPLLWRIDDGDSKPYARTFAAAQLSVRQNAPGADGPSTVTISYGGRSLTLRPGERSRARDARGEVEFFLESSYYTRAASVELAEGDPYHVRLIAWRVQGQGR
jgi:hypothetical protein